jgi:transposase
VPIVQRSAIVVLHKQGRTRQEIGQQADVSQPTVRRWIARYEESKDVTEEKHGRPRCTDEALDTAIAFTSHVEPFTPPRGIKRKLNLDISDDTIARRLDEAGLHARLARHVFTLTDEHKRRRLSFANGYSDCHFTEEDWCKVILADESTFLGARYHGRAFVRRPDGEALNPEYCLDKRPQPVQVPAWACFTAHGPGYMAMYEGSLDGAGLRDIMRDYLIPTAEEHFGERAE